MLCQTKLPGAPGTRQESAEDTQKEKSGKEKLKEKGVEREKHMHRDAQTNLRAMRSTDVDAIPPSRQEVESLPDQDITCTEEGMAYLESTLLTVPDVPYMADMLVGALFQISMLPGIKGSKINMNAVHTVAYVLAGLDTDDKAQAIAGAMVDQMAGQLDSLKERAEKVVDKAQVRLQEVANSMKVQMDSVASSLSEGMRAASQGMSENAAKLTVSSIKYTTKCLCHMHWLSPISLIIIGILPIIHSLYFSCFCTAEALWTPMDSFQLYSHLVRIRSAA